MPHLTSRPAAALVSLGVPLLLGRPDPGVGEELEVVAGPEAGQAAELAGLLELGQVAVDVRPVVRLVEAVDVALEVDAPDVELLGREAERLEGDGHLGAPAVRPHDRFGPPDRLDGVLLDAAGIDGESDARPLVVVGVEDELDRVVLVPLVAGRQLGPDLVGLGVLHEEGEVERVLVEGGPDEGLLGGLGAVDGVVLIEAGDGLDGLPAGVVDEAVDLGRGHRDAAHVEALGGLLRAERSGEEERDERRNGQPEQRAASAIGHPEDS